MSQKKDRITNNYSELKYNLKDLMKSPIKMKIMFFLFTFKELSLSQITNILSKPKTTLHHNLKQLEHIDLLTSREQITKNYRERYYSISSQISSFLKTNEDKINVTLSEEDNYIFLLYILKSFSIQLTSIFDRISDLIEKDPIDSLKYLQQTVFKVYTLEKKKAKSLQKQINQVIQEFFKTEIIPEKSLMDANKKSFLIYNILLPYGNLFKEFL